MGEWRTATVGDVALRVTKGTTPTTIGGRFVDDGINFVKVESVTDDGRIDASKLAHVDEATNDLLSRSILRANDVLFTIAGTIGRVALVSSTALPANTNQAVAIIRPNDDLVDPRFLYYVLRDGLRLQHANSRVVQSVQANFSLAELRTLSIPIPDIAEQRAIAHVLGSLDDKIDLNRRMNETLEAMARALFKSWFVDFDPVRAKAEGGDPGVPQPIADLFPDRLEDSELGRVPAGWAIGRLADIAAQTRDMEDPRLKPDELFSHYSIPAFDAEEEPVSELGRGIRSQKWRVEPGTVLVSKLNPKIERVWLVDVAEHDRAISSTEFMVLRPRIPFTRVYVYCLSRSEAFRQGVEGLVTGTSGSHQRAHAGSILDLAVALPSHQVIDAFDRKTEALLARMLTGRHESRVLASLRDALLPKLTSGEIRVPDAARMLDAAPV